MSLLFAFVLIFGCPCHRPDVVTEVIEEPPTVIEPEVDPPMEVPEHVKTVVENFSRVYFETDSDSLTGETKGALDANVEILQKHPDVKVQIQGHTDERGTTDYNLALGDRRANAVKEYLVVGGIGPSRLTVLSYGEELPADSSSTERAWSQNRRAEFVVTWGGEGEVKGTVE